MSDAVIDITSKEQLDGLIADNADKVIFVDFWAEWCGPCRMLGPVLHDIADANPEKALVLKVDVDSNQDLAMEYSVRSIPQVNIFKAGEQVDQFVGALPPDQIQAHVDKHSK